MHSVSQTHAFQRAVKASGMSEREVEDLITRIALDPMCGDEIEGTGGCRKVRVAGKGKGKSGGYRTVTFYSGPDIPVFLLTVFAKGEKISLTRGEKNALADLTKKLVEPYRQRVVSVGVRA